MPKAVPAREHDLEKEVATPGFSVVAQALAEVGRHFYDRGWVMGTSGNFSAVIRRDPFRLAITATGVDKGLLATDQIVQVGPDGKTVEGSRRPSDEVKLHLTIVRRCGAGAVLHTHSVWATLLSETFAGDGGVELEGYEMLKGLARVRTHTHKEWVPIIENSQDTEALSRSVEETLEHHPTSHGFLVRRHGLYTWGQDLVDAKRHVEIFEFLLEVVGRTMSASAKGL